MNKREMAVHYLVAELQSVLELMEDGHWRSAREELECQQGTIQELLANWPEEDE